MSKTEAHGQAVARAVAALAGVDWPARLAQLDLPAPQDGSVRFPFLGSEVQLDLADLQLRQGPGGSPTRPADRILLLHYLLHPGPLALAGRLISFREFPGGSAYLGPFRSRTTEPLVARFGNDLGLLRERLGRFAAEPVPLGDLAARIHAFGALHVTLIYSRGDEELGPSAELLFDATVRRVFGAEDAAVLASRICLGLL